MSIKVFQQCMILIKQFVNEIRKDNASIDMKVAEVKKYASCFEINLTDNMVNEILRSA